MFGTKTDAVLGALALGVVLGFWLRGVGAPSGSPERGEWKARILSGAPFHVVFDATAGKFDDSVFAGSADPLGSLRGGQTYEVRLHRGTFECTGHNQNTSAVGTWTYPIASSEPRQHLIALWGCQFRYDDDGSVYHKDWGLVGHLAMPGQPPAARGNWLYAGPAPGPSAAPLSPR